MPFRTPSTYTTVMLLLLGCALPPGLDAQAQGRFRDRLKQRSTQRASDTEKLNIAGLKVAVWEPKTYPAQGAPLVVFSHGFHGMNTQSKFLMKAMSTDGYLVMAPNHQDALGNGFSKPEIKFSKFAKWSDQNYTNRRDDIVNLVAALHKDPHWQGKIDWSKLVLSGHSLGGYTAMGCAGAWPSWKLPDVKAVLALSPYCHPFAQHKTLSGLKVPLMYQSGTRDLGMLPFIKHPGGAFDQSVSPAYLVVFDKASHFAFTDLNRNAEQKELINHYSLAFLDKYVMGNADAKPETKLNGVTELDAK